MKSQLDDLVEVFNIAETVPLQYPHPMQAPLKGLKQHKDGYMCTFPDCSYASLKESTMVQHWKDAHAGHLHLYAAEDRYKHPVYVQAYFAVGSTTYWAVNPDLTDRGSDNLYAGYLRDVKPLVDDHGDFDDPLTQRDIPPWLRFAAFNDFLGDYVTKKDKRTLLVNAASRPKRNDPVYGQLHDWVFEYLDSVRDVARFDIPYLMLRYIKSYHDGSVVPYSLPLNDFHININRINGEKAFQILDDDSRLKEYGTLLVNLLTYADRSLYNDQIIQLPFSEVQKGLVRELCQSIHTSTKNLDVIHRLFYTFSEPPHVLTSFGKWKDPLLCFIAIHNLCITGDYRPVSIASKEFAEWKYLIRSSILSEVGRHTGTVPEIEESVISYTFINLI